MKKSNQPMKGLGHGKPFDETSKRHRVDLSMKGDRTVKEIAEALGLMPTNLYQSRSLYGQRPALGGGGQRKRSLEQAEEKKRELHAEVPRIREREIVQKITAHPHIAPLTRPTDRSPALDTKRLMLSLAVYPKFNEPSL